MNLFGIGKKETVGQVESGSTVAKKTATAAGATINNLRHDSYELGGEASIAGRLPPRNGGKDTKKDETKKTT